jgi:hypothetical protein
VNQSVHEFPELAQDVRSEIDKLCDELEPRLEKRKKVDVNSFKDLRARRFKLLARQLGREPKEPIERIVCLGDSNTMFFDGAERLKFFHYRRSKLLVSKWINRGFDLLPLFRVFHVGPGTAWNAGDRGTTTRTREKIEILMRRDIPPGSRVLLSFGEIDCRSHMTRFIQQGRPLEDVVDATAEKFVKFPAWMASHGLRPLVWAPPQILPRDEGAHTSTFPFIGPYELRRDITYAYIERLRYHCARHNLPIVALAGTYHPKLEKVDTSFFHDGIHLSQRLMPLALAELAKTGFLPEGCRPQSV